MVIEIIWRRQKRRMSHIDKANQRDMKMPSIDVNARSRDCHATDALRAISV